MEEVLAVYARPYDAKRPVVCMDEKSKELHDTPRGELPLTPGGVKRVDCDYERNGTANLFMQVEPLVGKCRVAVTDRRTAIDFAEQLRILAEEEYPAAEMIVLVTDNLNTHHIGCLYERFEAEKARSIAERIEWHYTPEHGSWLNMAEIELSVLSRQCLSRRIADKETLQKEVMAWWTQQNAQPKQIKWHFSTTDARAKLRRLYPVWETLENNKSS